MHLNQRQVAARVNRLARLKAQIASLSDRAASDIEVLKKQGGGESAKWRAELVTMPKHTVVIPRHKQLRLYEKT